MASQIVIKVASDPGPKYLYKDSCLSFHHFVIDLLLRGAL